MALFVLSWYNKPTEREFGLPAPTLARLSVHVSHALGQTDSAVRPMDYYI